MWKRSNNEKFVEGNGNRKMMKEGENNSWADKVEVKNQEIKDRSKNVSSRRFQALQNLEDD